MHFLNSLLAVLTIVSRGTDRLFNRHKAAEWRKCSSQRTSAFAFCIGLPFILQHSILASTDQSRSNAGPRHGDRSQVQCPRETPLLRVVVHEPSWEVSYPGVCHIINKNQGATASADQVPFFLGVQSLHDTCLRALSRLPSPVRVPDVFMAVPK